MSWWWWCITSRTLLHDVSWCDVFYEVSGERWFGGGWVFHKRVVSGEAGGRASGGEKKEKGKNERRVIKIMRKTDNFLSFFQSIIIIMHAFKETQRTGKPTTFYQPENSKCKLKLKHIRQQPSTHFNQHMTTWVRL